MSVFRKWKFHLQLIYPWWW